ncbi:MAG TPA: GYF domain-containing protein, partial [Planctomycetaceae bacterium]|nr:GYF domain-containing protein [Planctomycetaceae bacterium]
MPVPDEVWFVQMQNVGTCLGPMPLTALAEMARTGVMLPHDLVRRDKSTTWQPASELPELSGEFEVSLPSAEAAEVGVLSEDDSITLSESAMTSAVSVPVIPRTFAAANPSPDVVVLAAEPQPSVERASPNPSVFEFETAAKSPLADSLDAASHEPAMPAEATATPPPFETTRTMASATAAGQSVETVLPNIPSRSSPAASRPPLPQRWSPKVERGPSMLAKCTRALSALPALLTRPIDNRLVMAVTVVALLVWYFYPSGRAAPRPPPQTAEVAGVVRLNGKPVSNALVLFRPDRSQGTVGPPSVGQTDAAGQFKLTINNTHAGAVVGKHQVAVQSRGSDGRSPGSFASSGS